MTRIRRTTARQRRDFADAYTAVELLAWSSESFAERLASHPRAVLGEFGVQLPDGVRVVVDRASGRALVGSESADLADALRAWESGWAAGELRLSVPADRHVPTGALSDDELAGVVGGHRVAGCYASACCAAD